MDSGRTHDDATYLPRHCFYDKFAREIDCSDVSAWPAKYYAWLEHRNIVVKVQEVSSTCQVSFLCRSFRNEFADLVDPRYALGLLLCGYGYNTAYLKDRLQETASLASSLDLKKGQRKIKSNNRLFIYVPIPTRHRIFLQLLEPCNEKKSINQANTTTT